MRINFPESVVRWLLVFCMSSIALLLPAMANPPSSAPEVVLEPTAQFPCSATDSWEFFSASSVHSTTVKIASSTHSLSLDCVVEARNIPGLQMGAGIQFTEGGYNLGYQSNNLESDLLAEGVGLGLSLSWRLGIPRGLELFGSGQLQWVSFLETDVQKVLVQVGEVADGKFDFSDFAKQHIEVQAGLKNFGVSLGLSIPVGRFSIDPLVSLQTAVLEGRINADMSAEALLRALDKESLTQISKGNTMFLTGLGGTWCSHDSGRYCFFALIKGGLLATDHWALYGQAGVRLHFP